MKSKNDLIWCWSLLITSIVTLIVSGSGIIGIELPDVAARILGIIDLIALPFLVYTSVKKFKKDKE